MSTTSEDFAQRRAKTLDKVRKLLAKAQATDFEEEAKSFEAMADKLMVEFTISEFELAQDDPKSTHYKPEFREYDFDYDVGEFVWTISSLIQDVAKHCGAIPVEWAGSRKIRIFGYPADLDYIDLMATNLAMHIVRTINPKWDPDKSEGENLYNLRNAGFNWEQIWYMQHPKVFVDPERPYEGVKEPWERRHGVRYTNVVKKWAEARNLPRNFSSNRDNYRTQFMDAYRWRIKARLDELKQANTSEQGLVLVSMKDNLREALWEVRPDLKPHPSDCACATCAAARRARLAPARTRGRGAVYRGPAYNQYANAAGRNAANSADLGQTRIANNRGEIK